MTNIDEGDGWEYTGGDPSGVVEAVLRRIETSEIEDVDEKIRMLGQALDVEEDPNWRALILAWTGYACEAHGRLSKAQHAYERAVNLVDAAAATFQDVVEDHLYSLYLLVSRFWDPSKDYKKILPHLPVVLAYRDVEGLENDERWLLMSAMASAIVFAGVASGQEEWSYRAALNIRIIACKYLPDDPGALHGLMIAYFNVGELGRCGEIYDAYRRVASSDDSTWDSVESLMHEIKQSQRNT